MEVKPLTLAEYASLPLGEDRWSFDEFGRVSLATVITHCKEDLKLSALLIGRIEAAHSRHPMKITPAGK